MAEQKQNDVVVIGGGVVGAAVAYHLAEANIESTIVDRDPANLEASGKAYGGLDPTSGTRDSAPLAELASRSFDLHTEMSKSHWREWKYQSQASLSLAFNDVEAATLQRQVKWVNKATERTVEWLDTTDTLSLEDRINPSVHGSAYHANALAVDPTTFTKALRVCSGSEIVQGTVIAIHEQSYGSFEIDCTDREPLHAKFVVVAAGPWTASIGSLQKLKRHVTPLKGQIVRVVNGGEALNKSVGYNGNYAATRLDNLVWAGTTEEAVGFESSVTKEAEDRILSNLALMLPGLDIKEVRLQTACLRPMSSDGLPILGPVRDGSRLFIATGAGRKGILLAPAMGKLIAQAIAGVEPDMNLEPFSPQRFG